MKSNKSRQPKGGIIIKPIGPIFPGPGGFYPPNQGPKPPGQYPPWQWPYPYPQEPGPVIPEYPLVKMKSVFNESFVILGYNNVLYAVNNSPKESASFKIIPVSNYQVKIKAVDGGFVRVNKDDLLLADANNNNATIFNQFKTGDMEFSLMAPNGYYVRVRDKDGALVAKAENAGPRTRFKFRKVG